VSLNGVAGTYIQVPNGVWFTNDFTVEGWVYVRSYNKWSRFFDFGNGEYFQDVYVALSEDTTGVPKMGIFNTGNVPARCPPRSIPATSPILRQPPRMLPPSLSRRPNRGTIT
jgi:hypothetical protein